MRVSSKPTAFATPSAAFLRRLEQSQSELRRFITARLSNPADADDVLQDTLLRAHQHAGDLRDPERLHGWLKTIAQRLIHDLHQRQGRHGKWAALCEEAVEARGEVRDELLARVDDVFRMLPPDEENKDTLLTLALHYCLEWSPEEIALAMGVKPGTIRTRIKRAKPRLRAATGPEDLEVQLYWKSALLFHLYNAGLHPLDGVTFRNSALLRESLSLMRLLSLRHPDHPWTLGRLAQLCLIQAKLAEFPDDMAPYNDPDQWRRDLWDKTLLREGIAHYRRFKAMKPQRAFELQVDYFYATHSPPANAAVDWNAVAAILDESQRLQPTGHMQIHVAACRLCTNGPLAAARYLEGHLRNAWLRDSPVAHFKIGHYYYRAGRRAEAARHLRRYLKFQDSDAYRGVARRALADCKTRKATDKHG